MEVGREFALFSSEDDLAPIVMTLKKSVQNLQQQKEAS